MLTVFMEHKILSGVILLLLLLSIICQIVIGVIYQRIIRETDHMSSTGNKLLKQFKMKFANCYQLNEGVANIPVFVDRFIGKISVMRLTLTGFQHLSGQFMLLSVVAAGTGACMEIIHGETLGRTLPFYIVSFLGLYIYFSVSGLVDIQGKKEKLKINLVDYLENHMVNKLKQSQIDWAELTGGEDLSRKENNSLREKIGLSAVREVGDRNLLSETKETEKEEAPDNREKTGILEEKAQAVFSKQEEQELEELLREFLA